MSYKLEVDLLNKAHRLRVNDNNQKTTITIHSTGNLKSTARNERDWLDNLTNKRNASWHYVVEEGKVIQAIPDNETAWHCGNSEGNKYSIGVEIIESGNRTQTLDTAAIFVADKLTELGLTAKDLRKHKDWSGKNCPRILIDDAYIKNKLNWNWFVKTVEAYMEGENVKRYKTIDELPVWAKPTIQKLVNQKKIADANNLDLSEDMIRVLVIMSR